MIAITIPVLESLSELGASSSSVRMITRIGILPAIVEPDWVIELAAIAGIIRGTWLGGWELLPGLLVQVPPH
jgi:hypothetical protein